MKLVNQDKDMIYGDIDNVNRRGKFILKDNIIIGIYKDAQEADKVFKKVIFNAKQAEIFELPQKGTEDE